MPLVRHRRCRPAEHETCDPAYAVIASEAKQSRATGHPRWRLLRRLTAPSKKQGGVANPFKCRLVPLTQLRVSPRNARPWRAAVRGFASPTLRNPLPQWAPNGGGGRGAARAKPPVSSRGVGRRAVWNSQCPSRMPLYRRDILAAMPRGTRPTASFASEISFYALSPQNSGRSLWLSV
jgi:hypothetical protein